MAVPTNAPGSNLGSIATGVSGKEMRKEDILDALNDETETPEQENELELNLGDEEEESDEDKEKKEKSSRTTKKDSEEEQEEQELEIEEEIDESKLTLDTVPARKEIIKAFPDLFKKFPQLEHVLYREKAYTEMFATIEDAREVKERAENFEKFESTLLAGNPESVFKSLKDSDNDAFASVVDNLMPTLAKVDQTAYYHIIGNVIKNTIIGMSQGAKSARNKEDKEALETAALILNQYVFGNDEFVPPQLYGKKRTEEEDSGKKEVENERQQLKRERFETAQSDMGSKVDNLIKNTISNNIDPKGAMTNYVKRTAINDVITKLDQAIASDERFRKAYDKQWEKAFEQNFSSSVMEETRRMYLSKAKTLLPSIIKSVRAEALNNRSERTSTDTTERVRNRDTSLSERSSAPRTTNDERGKVPKGMSSLDFLNS